MLSMMTPHVSSFLILMATMGSFSPTIYGWEHRCPADITELALTSSLHTNCNNIGTHTRCKKTTHKYRTNDGSCNHKDNKGSQFAEIDRLLPPIYADGSSVPRQHGVGGENLPSARNLTVNLLTPRESSPGNPLILFQWGQWTSHDILSTSVNTGGIRCCGQQGERLLVPDCFPINVPPNDPTRSETCMNFVRTRAAKCRNKSTVKPRTQTNDVTTFLDNSNVYGSDDQVAQAVREPGGYLLRTKFGLFPPESNGTCYKPDGSREYCFLAGDHRVNQHTYLSTIHTFWLREHNRIATELKKLNPRLHNETIFQTAKQIVNAVNQGVTYNEYLPTLLGADATRWKLTSTSGRSTYKPQVNPSLVTEFTTAAFRLGHTQSPAKFPIGNELVLLRYLYNRPGIVLDHFEDIVAAMAGHSPIANQGSQKVDKHFTEELTQYLLYNPISGRGGDLLSTNIQRGRDHGLPTYVQVREFCCLPPITGFNDTALGPEGHQLGQFYKSVQDIDLYTGILHEPADIGLAGPTIRCLVGLQFYRLKYGDKHFYDNDRPSGFTDEQLESIRSVTLGHVICHHTNLESIQRNVFEFTSSTNKEESCSKLKQEGVNLKLFV